MNFRFDFLDLDNVNFENNFDSGRNAFVAEH